MTKSFIFAAMLMLPLTAAPSLSEGMLPGGKLISDDSLRAVGAELYSDILIQACRAGWRFPRTQIESGFERHVRELRLQLVDQGFTIVPDLKANNSLQSLFEMISVAKRHSGGLRQFGCSRQYWLDM